MTTNEERLRMIHMVLVKAAELWTTLDGHVRAKQIPCPKCVDAHASLGIAFETMTNAMATDMLEGTHGTAQ